MNKKLIGAILCVFVLMVGVIPAMEDAKEQLKDEISLINQIVDILDDDVTNNPYAIATSGPVLNIFSKVDIVDGDPIQMKLIQRNLDRRLIRASVILRYVPIFEIDNLSFTVEYKSDIHNNSRFSYFTLNGSAIYDEEGNFVEIVNDTYTENVVHKITVENFSGEFVFFRTTLFRSKLFSINMLRPFLFIAYFNSFHRLYLPARFLFSGTCETLTIE